ncbi:hypothetical protein C8Q74DRAFT_489512 [Fomes fomentarius]|nr:hypothetical protein C8Q74DRAFT_489512 [Fomes fomentarius]
MRTRLIMTGAYLRPTIYYEPFPRLTPQPAHITGMRSKWPSAAPRQENSIVGLETVLTDLKELLAVLNLNVEPGVTNCTQLYY